MAHPSDERAPRPLRACTRRSRAAGTRLLASLIAGLLLTGLVATSIPEAPASAPGEPAGISPEAVPVSPPSPFPRGQGAAPADSLPAASVAVSADSVTVGDRFILSIVTRHRGNRRVLLPDWSASFSPGSGSGSDPGRGSGPRSGAVSGGSAPTAVDTLPRLGDLRVLHVAPRRVRSGKNGTRIDSVAITVTTFALDSTRVPPVPIRMAGETDTLELRTAAHTVGVRSLVPVEARELRGLAPIASFAAPLWPWLAGALGALAAVAAAVYWLRRDSEEGSAATLVEERIDPYREVEDRLDALEAYELDGDGRIKPFFVELADALRTLIHRTREIPALEMTTSELLEGLRDRPDSDPFDCEVIRRLEVVLRLCDLAKFADARPPAEDSRSALRAARAAVTRMKEQAVREETVRQEAVREEIVKERSEASGRASDETPSDTTER